MSKLIDMSNWKMWEHGVPDSRLVVMGRAENTVCGSAKWVCKCMCGNNKYVIATGRDLRTGHTKSCGCLNSANTIQRNKDGHKNTYDLAGEYGIGYTVKGEPFWFDLEDYDKIKDYCWYYNKDGYVITNNPGAQTSIRLHRMVMNAPDNMDVDHIIHPHGNEHKIDNRKSNLRLATRSQNQMNRSIAVNNVSGVVGVHFSKRDEKWIAYIKINGKRKHLGSFDNKDDAIYARQMAEELCFGEYKYRQTEQEDCAGDKLQIQCL